MTLTDITTPGQSEAGSNGKEDVLHNPQRFRVATSTPDAI